MVLSSHRPWALESFCLLLESELVLEFPWDNRLSPVPLGIGVIAIVLEMVEICQAHVGYCQRMLLFKMPVWPEILPTLPCPLKKHFSFLLSALREEYLLIVRDPSQTFLSCLSPRFILLRWPLGFWPTFLGRCSWNCSVTAWRWKSTDSSWSSWKWTPWMSCWGP